MTMSREQRERSAAVVVLLACVLLTIALALLFAVAPELGGDDSLTVWLD